MDSYSVVSKEDCLKILNRFSKENLQLINYEVIPFGSEPLGFLGEHSKLQITAKTLNNKKVVLTFFMKTIPSDTEAHKSYVVSIGVFKKEALLYKNLLSKFHNLTKNHWSPTCYFVNSDSHVVLEDLSLKGFEVVKEKSKTFDYIYCKCLTETLARFHVSTIIFEELNSSENNPYRIYDHYKDILYETTFSWEEGHARNDWLKITTDTLLALCKKIDEYREKDVETPLKKLIEDMKMYIAPSRKYRNVINHGDLWSNNIMFNKRSNPDQCILVDYQMARYVPPCFDFLSFLYLTTTENFHETHFDSLADLYYNTFEKELNNKKINPKDIMTKESFLESCVFYKQAALLEATMFGTIVYLNGDFSKDMLADPDKFDDFMRRDRSKLVCALFDEDEVYRGRIVSLLNQLLKCIL